MAYSGRFVLALHILLALEKGDGETRVTSESLAQATGANAVNIRKLTGRLRASGLIRPGNGAGRPALARDAGRITLREIFEAVEGQDAVLFATYPAEAEDGEAQSGIRRLVENTVGRIEDGLMEALAGTSLADLTGRLPAQTAPAAPKRSRRPETAEDEEQEKPAAKRPARPRSARWLDRD